MRLILALLIPWFVFFTIGKPIQGLICLVLQLTLIGWIPAAIWAVWALNNYTTDKKIAQAGMGGMPGGNGAGDS
ncbi:MAG: YqaE/Pmp3 family membrane protein [Kangiella sp.]|nr:YqaE/Pmp3 family membrane protein [Kangiella sp.]